MTRGKPGPLELDNCVLTYKDLLRFHGGTVGVLRAEELTESVKCFSSMFHFVPTNICVSTFITMMIFPMLFIFLQKVLAEDILADTPLGKVKGHTIISRGGRNFSAFSGIPYAKPPVGDLRFEPPQPVEPWTGTKNALEDGPFCVQYNTYELHPKVIGVEDCLYLSVYTHNLTGKAPVLVHFHGGGFISGNGARKTGPQYLMDEDLVIVDVNYRVSMFGFLSFEDERMPGNQGMKDQVMSLRWVQANIASFGGDPRLVTLVGESAGAKSVHHHTVSPLSKGLFHRGIAESGSSYNPSAVVPPGRARNTSLWLLALVNCTNRTTVEALHCLKKKDAAELARQLGKMRGWQDEVYAYYAPVLEPKHPGAFLVGPLSAWRHEPVPLIVGTTSAEGLLKTLYLKYLNISYDKLYMDFEEVAPRSLLISGYSSEPKKVARAIKEYYFPKGKISENDWVNLTTMYSDSYFTVGLIDGAYKHPSDVYFYYFDYLGYYSLGGDAKKRNNTVIFGAYHTDEIIYLWYNKNFKNLQGEDLLLSKKLVKLWADFAKYGKPTPDPSEVNWEKWLPEKHKYLHINKEGFKMEENLAEDRYRFWKTLKYRDILEI